MRWLSLCVLLVSACQGGGTFVQVKLTATGTVPPVDEIDITATLAGATAQKTLRDPGGGTISFPTDVVFQIQHGQGTLMLTAKGKDSAGMIVSSGTGSVAVVSGKIATLTVALSPAAPGATVPDAPSAVMATAQPGGTASVSFTAPADNGSAITSYTVTSTPDGITTTGTASPITVTGLTVGTSYTFDVTATNGIGTGPAGTSNSVTIADVPVAPTSVVATPQAGLMASVTWTAPADDGGSAITGYTVVATPGGATQMVTAPPATFSGLTDGTSYTFTVAAINAVGTGPTAMSNSITAANAVPAAPTQVSTCASDGAVLVYWMPSAGATSYNVYYSTAHPVVLASATKVAGALNGAKIPIANGTATSFTVTAVNSLGESAQAATTAWDTATPAAHTAVADTLFAGPLATPAINAFAAWSTLATSGATPTRSITGIDATWMGLFVDKELATIYASTFNNVTTFDSVAGSAMGVFGNTVNASRILTYPANFKSQGLTVDTTRNILYLYNYDSSTGNTRNISLYYPACRVTGAATPLGAISGGNTTLNSSTLGPAIDPTTDTLYIANGANVIVFNNASTVTGTANLAPARTISVSGVTLNIDGIALDPGRGLLYIADDSTNVYRLPLSSNGVVTVPASDTLTLSAAQKGDSVAVVNDTLFLGVDSSTVVNAWSSAHTVSGNAAVLRTVSTSSNSALSLYYVP